MEVALFEPEIPPNTGNIARLCVNVGVPLRIIGNPSFDLSEKAVRRAGLDYWHLLDFQQFPDWEAYRRTKKEQRFLFFTKFGATNLWDIQFRESDCLVFGKETKGLPPDLLETVPIGEKVYIPMVEDSRSINLSNAVAIVVYEAFRQIEHRKFSSK